MDLPDRPADQRSPEPPVSRSTIAEDDAAGGAESAVRESAPSSRGSAHEGDEEMLGLA